MTNRVNLSWSVKVQVHGSLNSCKESYQILVKNATTGLASEIYFSSKVLENLLFMQEAVADMAKSFQPVVVSRSYKDWNSAGPVKVLADLNNF